MDEVVLLDDHGALREDPRAPLEVTAELCTSLLRDMSCARRFDQEALALQRIGRLSLWLQSAGQEGAQIGAVHAVDERDWIVPSYREQAMALTRGLTPPELLRQWAGRAHAGWDPHPHRFNVYTLVLGSQLLHAVGMGMAAAFDERDEVVLACFGDGASSQGDANEAFNWAAVTGAPVVFFCQDNGWAISTPQSAQMREPLYRRAEGFGIRSWLVDGNDVLAVLAVTRQAAAHARNGDGPAMVHARTYRMGGHSTSDDPGRYRDAEEVARWAARDPITRLRALMGAQGWLTDAVEAHVAEACALVTQATRQAADELDEVAPLSMFDDVLAGPHPALAEQRANAAAILAAERHETDANPRRDHEEASA